jgi:periplasmic copper chaperone A
MASRRALALILPLALAVGIAACDDDDAGETTTAPAETTTPMAGDPMTGGVATAGDITVTDVWVRQPAEGQTLSAGYGMISNTGDADVTLIGASVPFDATIEIHQTLMGDDGVMQMQEVPEGFVIPAGGTFELKPGGPHIMLIDIDPADITDVVELTMIFDDGTEVTVTAPVRPLDMGAMGNMGGGEMGDGMTGTTMGG